MSASRGNLKMAMTSLHKAKWRSVLTMLGIIIGIVAVVTIIGIGDGMKQQVAGQISQFGKDLITIRPGRVQQASSKQMLANSDLLFGRTSLTGLSEQDFTTVKNSSNVNQAAPLGMITGSVTSSDNITMSNTTIIATSPDLPGVLSQNVHYGSFFDDNSDLSNAVIGQQVAYDLFGQVAPLGKTFTLRNQSFTVRGVFSDFNAPPLSATANFDHAIFIPYQMADQLTSNATQYYAILAKPTSLKQLHPAIAQINRNLRQQDGGEQDFTVLDEQQSISMSSGIIDLLTTFITAVAAISLVVGGIGIMNIMLVSVTERMHEIGIRKAVGATNQQILSQFMLESTVLSAAGGVLGILISLLLNLALHAYTSYKPVISWSAIVLATVVSIIVGVVFGTAPAIKAARKDPIEALRHE
ncbi:MAG: ABC transporter permease [Candidatus Saccharibacteria bacterium]